MSSSPNIAAPMLTTSYPAATLLQDGKGFAQGDLFDSGANKGTWQFCVAAANIALGGAVAIDRTGSATPLTKALADAIARVGIAPVAVTSGDYFWAQLSGSVDSVLVKASSAAGVPLYTTATAGTLSDVATGQTPVVGLKLTTARGGTDGVAAGFIVGAGAVINEATLPATQYNAISSGNATIAAAKAAGAAEVVFATSGATALTTPTAAAMLAAIPGGQVGTSYVLRIYNTNGGTLTLTADASVTITGTATIGTAVWREYFVTFDSLTTAVWQNIGSGVAN